jgi:hypothetical protein
VIYLYGEIRKGSQYANTDIYYNKIMMRYPNIGVKITLIVKNLIDLNNNKSIILIRLLPSAAAAAGCWLLAAGCRVGYI